MKSINTAAMTEAANAYIDEREGKAGGQVPFSPLQRELCVKLMAAFACDCIAKELLELFGEAAMERARG